MRMYNEFIRLLKKEKFQSEYMFKHAQNHFEFIRKIKMFKQIKKEGRFLKHAQHFLLRMFDKVNIYEKRL